MSALPTPKVVDLDDPLMPRPQPTTPAPAAKKPAAPTPPARRAIAALADDSLVAVFARLPESLSQRLGKTVAALNDERPRHQRVSQQDLLGALVDHYVTPADTAALEDLVDGYRARRAAPVRR